VVLARPTSRKRKQLCQRVGLAVLTLAFAWIVIVLDMTVTIRDETDQSTLSSSHSASSPDDLSSTTADDIQLLKVNE